MTAAQTKALAIIRAAGSAGVDAWRLEGGKMIRNFALKTITALIDAKLIVIANDSNRPICSTYYRAS